MKNGGEFIFEILSGRLQKKESTEFEPLVYMWRGLSYELKDNHEFDENGLPIYFMFSRVYKVCKTFANHAGMSNPKWAIFVDGVKWRLSENDYRKSYGIDFSSKIYFSNVEKAIECCETAMAKRFRNKRGRNVIISAPNFYE